MPALVPSLAFALERSGCGKDRTAAEEEVLLQVTACSLGTCCRVPAGEGPGPAKEGLQLPQCPALRLEPDVRGGTSFLAFVGFREGEWS